jgi:hypothetical protein
VFPSLDYRGTFLFFGLFLVAGSFLSSPLIAERRIPLSVTFFVIGPGVSNVLEIGMIPLRLNKPVVGFRPIIEFCQEGERMEPEFLFPLLLLHN